MFENIINKTITATPISLDEAKMQCSVDLDYTDDDTLLNRLIADAIGIAEDVAGRDIAAKTNVLVLEDGTLSEYRINEASFGSITSIVYKDLDDNEITLNANQYKAYKREISTTVKFYEAGTKNPVTIEFNEMTITFTSGYSTSSDMPRSARAAVLIKINDLYDLERTTYTLGTNFRDNNSFEKTLGSFKVIRW